MTFLSHKIDEYLNQDYAPFHSPAHAGKLNPRDLSELDGLDNLQNPQEVLKDAQDQVAELFGAGQSLFLTGGASLGLQAACIALKIYLQKNNLRQPVLVARNVHKSTVAGIILAGLDVEWFEPEWHAELGAYTQITHEFWQHKNIHNYSAVILTNPSYEGFYSEIPRLPIPVIVDEAHGAHYHFSSELPRPALDYGADIVVQSWHKTLGSLTQTGVVHSSRYSKIPARYLANSLRLLQSTSPSYLLLESLCKVTALYQKQGQGIIGNTINLARRIPRELLISNSDPTRLLIRGKDLEEKLSEQRIAIEHGNCNYALATVNPGNSLNDIHRLEKALKAISIEKSYQSFPKPQFPSEQGNIRDSYLSSEGDLQAPCPPGIVVKIPGQE